MAALFLAPVYLAVCFYVLNWMLKWMAVCNNIFALACFPLWIFCPVHSDSYHFAVFFSDQKAGWTASDFKTHQQSVAGHISLCPDRYRHCRFHPHPALFFSACRCFLVSFQTDVPSHRLFYRRSDPFFQFLWIFSCQKTLHNNLEYLLCQKPSGHDTLKIALIADLHLGYNTDEIFTETPCKTDQQTADRI